ncbi:hypothetical protein [Streptomyces sp. NPDC002550]
MTVGREVEVAAGEAEPTVTTGSVRCPGRHCGTGPARQVLSFFPPAGDLVFASPVGAM